MTNSGGYPVDLALVSENNLEQSNTSAESVGAKHASPSLAKLALGYVGRVIFAGSDVQSKTVEEQYLHEHYLIVHSSQEPHQSLAEHIFDPAPEDIALLELAKKLDLSTFEILAVALALAVEQDAMAGRAIAHVQKPVGGSRPTFGLLDVAFRPLNTESENTWIAGAILSGNAIATGLLNVINDNAPIPEKAIQVPIALALALRKQTLNWPGATIGLGQANIRLPASIVQVVHDHAASLSSAANSALIIRSGSEHEARAVADAVARVLGAQPIFASLEKENLRGLGPLCVLNRLVPVFIFDVGPGETNTLPEVPGYVGPSIGVAGPDGTVDKKTGSVLSWLVSAPPTNDRQQLWQLHLGEPELAKQLAKDHVHSAGRIAELSQIARREAGLNQRKRPTRDDIRRAAWLGESGGLGALAQAITTQIPNEALVLPKHIRDDLMLLLRRCRERETLGDNLGVTVKARYQMGVRTLIVGASGTGKTLAAGWLATQLGLPLYRVDIASVTSKYIGETEKNLGKLLARAEQAEVCLLFDEADSLFGKRTDIKDANDRFANSQTNYLLQRIESYNGIVLLTSNSRARFDSAFTRRLDKIIEFPLPGPEERRALWQSHLGSAHQLSAKQLNQLAASSDVCGGDIRNVVLTAAVLATPESRPIAFNDVVRGLASEYRKLGRQMPTELKCADGNKLP